jgi:uncharacterized protein YecE (DUF72 family)
MKKKTVSHIWMGSCGARMSLAEYASLLPLVEVQHTFYQPPQIATLERWRNDVPDDFQFTIKAWQLITHESRSPTYRRLRSALGDQELAECGAFRDTPIVRDAWEVTRDSALALRARCILLQCPASFTPTDEHVENLNRFLETIDRAGIALAWEPRGAWPAELVHEICTEHNVRHAVDPFKIPTTTPERPYFRLHGRTGYRYRYEDSEMEEMLEMLPEDIDSFVLFNNVGRIEDAARFREVVKRAGRG